MATKWTDERLAKFRATMAKKKFSTVNTKKVSSVVQEYHNAVKKVSDHIAEINSVISNLMSERSELEKLVNDSYSRANDLND